MSPQPQSDLDALAAEPIDDADVRVLTALSGLYDHLDPVPNGLVARLQFGITLDLLHAEIAELQRAGDLVGVRGEASEVQTVTFSSASLTTMVTITITAADRARLDGWLVPGGGCEIELRQVGGSTHTQADADGRFVFADVPRGLAQLIVRRPDLDDQPPVIAPSIQL